MNAADFAELLSGVRRSGSGYVARCPAHEDQHQSLSFREGDDEKVLAYCHAGCNIDRIAAALGIKVGDLFPERNGNGATVAGARFVRAYTYRRADGESLFQVDRYEPKTFRPRLPGADVYGLPEGFKRVLYRLPEVVAAVQAGEPIYFVEGEKDAENLAALGVCATTSGSASSWKRELAEPLRDAEVIILPDNDDAGRKYASLVRNSLEGIAKSARLLALPNLKEHEDVSDWINRGGTLEKLQALVAGVEDLRLPRITAESYLERARVIEETAYPTGIPSIDRVCSKKGGLPGGAVVTIVGPAGSFKTALGMQFGLDRAKAQSTPERRKLFYCYMPDQGGHQPLDRIAETFGDVFNDSVAAEAFREAMEYLYIVDETADGVTLESFAKMVEAADDCAIAMIDTPQTVDSESEREELPRIALVYKLAKRIATIKRIPVITPSHVTRAASAARKLDDRTRELAAAYGGTKVEHKSQIIIFLEPIEDTSPQRVRGAIPKGIRGRVGRFELEVDLSSWRLREVVAEEEDAGHRQTDKERRKQELFDEEVLGYIKRFIRAGEKALSKDAAARMIRAEIQKDRQKNIGVPTLTESILRLLAGPMPELFVKPGPRGSHILYLPRDPSMPESSGE